MTSHFSQGSFQKKKNVGNQKMTHELSAPSSIERVPILEYPLIHREGTNSSVPKYSRICQMTSGSAET